MKAVLDVHYSGPRAQAACVVFASWPDDKPEEIHRVTVHGARPYHAGRFFERELPPLLAVLGRSGLRFSHILIDGYVHLKGDKAGLGAHLHAALPYSATVIGVAKNPLVLADRFVPIQRGSSTKALFVSAAGWPLDEAAAAVKSMHGPFRIPTLLRLADRTARGT